MSSVAVDRSGRLKRGHKGRRERGRAGVAKLICIQGQLRRSSFIIPGLPLSSMLSPTYEISFSPPISLLSNQSKD